MGDSVQNGVPDFGFAALHVGPRETAWLELPALRGDIAVCGYFAGHDDSSYVAARNQSPTIITRTSTKEERERATENERRLLARHVLCDWRGVVDAKTRQPVPFSAEMALEFLRQVPPDVLVRIITFFATRENFVVAREREAATKALAGNSPAGSSGS